MRVLVTGSQGTIGRPLVEELRRRGHEVWGCDLAHSSDPQYFRTDISSYRQVHAMDVAVDVVYNLAAEFGRVNGGMYYERLWETNCIGLCNVISLCLRHGSRLVHMSSSEAYGDIEEQKEDVLNSEVPHFFNEYALTKWANEKQIQIAKVRGLDATCIRLFNVYGPGEVFTPYRGVVSRFIHEALHGRGLTIHRGYRSHLYIDDAVRTLANVCDRQKWEPAYNIASLDVVSNLVLAGYVSQSTWPFPILASTPEIGTIVRKNPNIELAVRDLDHVITMSLSDGIRKTVEWVKQNDRSLRSVPKQTPVASPMPVAIGESDRQA